MEGGQSKGSYCSGGGGGGGLRGFGPDLHADPFERPRNCAFHLPQRAGRGVFNIGLRK